MDQLTVCYASGARAVEHIYRLDRQATFERLIGYFAHNLGNPLNVIAGRAAMMASGQVAEGEFARNARIIMEQSARMVRFLREIANSAGNKERGGRSADGAGEQIVDLDVIARDVVAIVGPVAETQGKNIRFENAGGAAPVVGNADSLLVALTHVIENAIRVTPVGRALTVRIRRELQSEGQGQDDSATIPCFLVEIDDEGPGIESDVLPRLFRPFTTTRGDQQAVGLGLFLAQSIAKEHGGWFDGKNRTEKGARFTLHLPERHQHAE